MTFGVLAATVALFAALPFVVDRWAAPRASPAGLVTLAMVRLAGLLLAPLALAACLAQLAGHHAGLGGATLGLAMALAALTIGRALWATWRAEDEWRRIGAALLAAGVPGPSGVTVVPLAAPTAFVAGDRIVVSAALFDALDPAELEAVLAHETAHLRGGHPRIAAWAHALSRGSFQIPPARAAESRVRQQLELLADRHVVDTLHNPEPIRAAMAKLSDGGPGGSQRLDIGHLTHERLRCLLAAPSSAAADRLVTITTAILAAVIVAAVCGALHVRLAGLGIAVCGLTATGLWSLLRPLHRPA